jgi:hypothetical protein
MQQIDELIAREVWIEGHAQKAILLRRRHLERPGLDHLALGGFQDPQLAADLDEKDAAIRSDLDLHRLRHCLDERLHLEPVVLAAQQ